MKTYKQLYRVYSTVSEFQFAGRDFYGVRVAWFVKDREEPIIPYERIADYHMNDPYLEVTSLGQHFTFPEALGLSNYLFEVRDFESQIEVAKLPLRASTLPIYDQFDLDDGECFIKLNESKNYSLPFAVWGYFCLRGPEIWWCETRKDSKNSLNLTNGKTEETQIVTLWRKNSSLASPKQS